MAHMFERHAGRQARLFPATHIKSHGTSPFKQAPVISARTKVVVEFDDGSVAHGAALVARRSMQLA